MYIEWASSWFFGVIKFIFASFLKDSRFHYLSKILIIFYRLAIRERLLNSF